MLYRKSVRLPAANYVGRGIYFLTVCCDRRRAYLSDPVIAAFVMRELVESASSHSFTVHAFCLMPDHIHFLAEGTLPTSDALEFARHFKQGTAFFHKQKTQRVLWEFGYYDHILRAQDGLIEVARYIWWNPVRKKLCVSPNDYPFSGSQTFTWMQESQLPSTWTAPWRKM
jgi:putative transposase